MHSPDAIVVGAGQSGLAAARSLTVRGLRTVVLEAGPDPGGSWPHYYDSLTLFSPARYSALPGLPFPGDPRHHPHRDEVVAYLRHYATRLDADIRTGQRVLAVRADGGGFTVHTPTRSLTAPLLVAATGGFGHPHRPSTPGLDTFAGEVLHSGEYRTPDRFTGQHVVGVGAGNSAVQIAVELAHRARVTLATRAPVTCLPQRPLGRDVHFWSTALGIDHLPVGPWLRRRPAVPVLDDGTYRSALDEGRPTRRPLFTAVDRHEVVWADGHREHVDTVLFATGYRPDLDYLALTGALDATGAPRQSHGVSRTHRGLGFVGLDWQRSLASATLRGVGRDADHVTRRLLARVRAPSRAGCTGARP